VNICTCQAEDALRLLGSSPEGLTHAEAAARLRKLGPNRIDRVAAEPLWRRLMASFTHFFALLLWLAAALSVLAHLMHPGEGMAVLALAIVAVIIINGLFAFWQDYRAERLLTALGRLLPHTARVRRDGRVDDLDPEQVAVGDVLLLGEGDLIPADCRLIRAFSLRVDSSTITGESVPQSRHERPADVEDALQSANILLAGTSVVSGEGEAAVFAVGSHTELGRIAHLTHTAVPRRSPFLAEIARVSRFIAAVAIALGSIFFITGLQLGLDPFAAGLFAIGIIVANVPEGLLPTVTLALAMGAQRMSRRKVLVRHLPAVETLGSATVICTDKTGTLTENRMTVERVWLGSSRKIETLNLDHPTVLAEDPRVWAVARWCQSLKPTASRGWLGDPIEVALVAAAESAQLGAEEPPLLAELPFDSQRRRMSVVRREPGGRVLYVKGAPEAILERSTRIALGEGEARLDAAERAEVEEALGHLTRGGLRVLALASRRLDEATACPGDEADLLLLGLVGIADPPRPGVAEAISSAKRAGIRVIMTTGDHPATALALARHIGLIDGNRCEAVTGAQLQNMSEAQLRLVLTGPAPVFARLLPEQKLRIVRALRSRGETVAVTGDGVNDAPALREADIGIAMGRTGSDVAREAADLVLVEDNFANIVDGIEEGRAVFDNVRKFMTYILTSNVPEILPYLAFALFGVPLPLTIIQILAVDLGTDMLPALALGAEPPHDGIMRRPPRPRGQRLLDGALVLRAYGFLGPIEALIALAPFFWVLHIGGWAYGQSLGPTDPLYLEATTACLTGIIVAQIANLFLCRSDTAAELFSRLRDNPLILVALAFEIGLILLIIYTSAGNLLFGTAPLGWDVWAGAALLALLMIAAEEGRKALHRRRVEPGTAQPGGDEARSTSSTASPPQESPNAASASSR
jgi:calcium-translocating P-type ATPase